MLTQGIYSRRTGTETKRPWKPINHSFHKEDGKNCQSSGIINSGVDSNANLVYKKDFDLGDYCTYINTEINIATDKRITEVMETYEGAATELSVTFGTDEVSTVKQLIKREV